MIENLYAVILAGGKGERFWPLSTPQSPKPFLRFFSERSLLQQTYDRARALVDNQRIVVVAGTQHAEICYEQLPEIPVSQILLEPSGRDTSAAIAYATLALPEEALMLILPADHLIPDTNLFAQTMAGAADFVKTHGGPATFGIRPTRPDTNYGYIEARPKNLGSDQSPVFSVARFIEKPILEAATELILSNSYYWNSGMFLWKVSRIRELLQRHLPELWSGMNALRGRRQNEFAEGYVRLPKISIDYGVMQKCEGIVVIPARFAWDDIGTWSSLLRILPVDGEGNLLWGNHTGIETKDCIIYAENHTIATAGIHDLVIVQRGNQTLVCTREYADRLKELLAKMSS